MSYPLTIRGPMPAADWTTQNPTLEQFEIGQEFDNGVYGKSKLGDGLTAWNDLDYWSPSGGGLQTVYTLPFEIAHADILTLPTTVIDIVPAQGAGKVIELVRGMLRMDSLAAAYTNVDATFSGSIIYPGNGDASNYFDNFRPAFVGQYIRYLFITPIAYPGSGVITEQSVGSDSEPLANLPLQLNFYNALLGNFTGGNSANRIKGFVDYLVRDFN